jgi:hypothetical protein
MSSLLDWPDTFSTKSLDYFKIIYFLEFSLEYSIYLKTLVEVKVCHIL